MAYFNQKMKSERTDKIKAIFKKYGVKGTFGVRNNSTFVVNVMSGDIDFFESFNRVARCVSENMSREFVPAVGYIDVNEYWYNDHFDGKALACIEEIIDAMNEGNWNESDVQTDYFNVGWYIDLNIGKWDKSYVLNSKVAV